MNNVVPSEGSKIKIRSPVIVADCKDNGVNNIFESQNDVIVFIAVFKAGYPNNNIRNNVRR